MVPIPYARSYTATVRGAILKFVACEQCHAQFIYHMEREASGSGTSLLFLDNEGASRRASVGAESALQTMLQSECDPVPCPDCGWYQEHMHATIRKAYHRWLFYLGIVLLIAGCTALVGTQIVSGRRPPADDSTIQLFQIATVLLPALGVGLIVTRWILAKGHDPNSGDVAQRLEIGKQLALRKADFEKMIQEQQASAAGADVTR